MDEDDYLQLSGLQHFAFCRRQWALIHIEQAWEENLRTVEGKIMHERAHDPFFTEKRGDTLITREMPIHSDTMRVSGKCDVVEFHLDESGVRLHGREGLWLPCPIEYKRGSPKISDADRLQLCAQAMCLEEMLLCSPIGTAFLYYGETRRRESVTLTAELRKTVRDSFAEMHKYYERLYTPRVKPTKSCNACSMKDICLPHLPKNGSVQEYINTAIGGET
jgi:CRISPR-associated exonuclease Cas4